MLNYSLILNGRRKFWLSLRSWVISRSLKIKNKTGFYFVRSWPDGRLVRHSGLEPESIDNYIRFRPDSRVGGCTPRVFLHIVFNNIQEPTASTFLLLVQKKGTKEKETRKLVGIFNPNPLRFKSKTGASRTRMVLRTLSCSNKRLLWSCFTFDARLRLTGR